jgi:hypothetical protein
MRLELEQADDVGGGEHRYRPLDPLVPAHPISGLPEIGTLHAQVG